ncbi:MAG: carboxy terminal-processing peptidase [Chitinophagaceae bacterium]
MLEKLEKLMLSKRTLPVLVVVLVTGILGAYSCKGRVNDNDTIGRQQQLLQYIGMVLERDHYSPKPIDDAFSRLVFKKYITSIDGEKDIFLKKDMDSLDAAFGTKIDDEIHGDAPMSFFLTAFNMLNSRIGKVTKIYNDILSRPFDFTTDETLPASIDSIDFPADDAAQVDTWRKRLKYQTLTRFVDLQDMREKAADSSKDKHKTDAELEKEARDAVKKMLDRSFKKFSRDNNEEQQYSLFVNTVCHIMDPHTDYFPPADKRDFDNEMGNKFYGIGAQLGQSPDGNVKIVEVIKGMPAWKSGKIHVNDVILKVAQATGEAVDISGYETTDAVKLIRGAKGSIVKLTIKNAIDGSVQVVTLQRDLLKQDELDARSAVLEKNGKRIGYISLPEFYYDFTDPNGAQCARDVATEIEKLKKDGIDGLVFDLQGNNGGSLSEVNKMVGMFVDGNPVVQVRDRNGNSETLNKDGQKKIYDGPMIVLVNDFSASAAEIFAAAIQDYHRGIIMGSDSYGKGTVQRQLPIGKANANGEPEFGALKLTFQKFYRINGESTQRKGVVPDIAFPDNYAFLKMRERDDDYALPYDKIPATTYAPWNPGYDASKIVTDAQGRMKETPLFSAMQKNIDWLDSNDGKPFNLNIIKYKEDKANAAKASAKDDSLLIVKNPVTAKAATGNYDKFYKNEDTSKGKRYQDWLRLVGKNLYINEAVNTMIEMVGAPNPSPIVETKKKP